MTHSTIWKDLQMHFDLVWICLICDPQKFWAKFSIKQTVTVIAAVVKTKAGLRSVQVLTVWVLIIRSVLINHQKFQRFEADDLYLTVKLSYLSLFPHLRRKQKIVSKPVTESVSKLTPQSVNRSVHQLPCQKKTVSNRASQPQSRPLYLPLSQSVIHAVTERVNWSVNLLTS